ncbi:MAG: 16S rRNA (guanine(966)-N(2))-methyltransferase RsmD [Clostridia bacterium]|nr:16S rRNA (guanine(966)-N(2))-methyltransferase RsmD [Clostridia bacterium]
MRVIAGICGGRKLKTPADDAVRPTTDKVKEALFSSIQFELEGADVLDAFAGSGQLGIEALSRGGRSAVFIDNSRQSLALIRQNLALCALQGETVQADTLEYLQGCAKQFDIAFLDPPYRTGLLQKALPAVSRVMREGGVILAECPEDEVTPDTLANGFVKVKTKKYGTMRLNYYRKGSE